MKWSFFDVAKNRQQAGQDPGIERRVRVAAKIHVDPPEDIHRVSRVQWIDQGVLGFRYIGIVIALNGLVQEGQPQQENRCQRHNEAPAPNPWPPASGYAGFHLSTGRRAAVTSSTRLVRVP